MAAKLGDRQMTLYLPRPRKGDRFWIVNVCRWVNSHLPIALVRGQGDSLARTERAILCVPFGGGSILCPGRTELQSPKAAKKPTKTLVWGHCRREFVWHNGFYLMTWILIYQSP